MTFLAILLAVIALAVVMAALYLGAMAFRTRSWARRAESLVPVLGQFVEIDGNRIHYVEKGQGPAILFVHGLGGQLHHLRHPLFDKLDGYRLIALDRPGSGYSVRAAGASARLTEQARVIAQFIDRLDLDRPLLVGHSLGGMVSLTIALEHPEKISGLALLSPLTHQGEGVPPEFAALNIRSPLLRRVLAHTVAIPTAAKYAEQTLAFVFGPQTPPPDYAVDGGAFLGLRPSHFDASASDFVAIAEDLPALQTRYGELKMPVGILFGTEDRVLDHQLQGLTMPALIAGLDLEILEGIGHMPQYAATEKVVAFIRRIAARAFAA